MANLCAEMRIRAERRLGEMLIEQKESGQMNKGQLMEGDKAPPYHRGRAGEIGVNKPTPYRDGSALVLPKLSEMGISHNMRSRAQATAKVPHYEFGNVIAEFESY